MKEKHFNIFLAVSAVIVICLLLGIAVFLTYDYIKDRKIIDENNDFEDNLDESNITESNNTTSDEEIVCGSDYYNCEGFESYEEAKKVYDFCRNSEEVNSNEDIHGLDLDGDGIPCEGLM
ncbi:excalibur calcium-binding domain-containing protein [Candidatus Pacearchaeota archaeon]|nr:excalibur calcium-binding domain-containing protein [Candidatus Pacearchaeota archaeon]